MVCNRCKIALLELLNRENFNVKSIELGKIVIDNDLKIDFVKLEKQLKELGFELIKDASKALVEKIKVSLIEQLKSGDAEVILKNLENLLNKNYSVLSKTFSRSEGMTLEKYLIHLKIEKAKEYIQLNQLNFSEIAYTLNYKNSSHLAKQFKHITGMSMTAYKNLQNQERKGLDKIV